MQYFAENFGVPLPRKEVQIAIPGDLSLLHPPNNKASYNPSITASKFFTLIILFKVWDETKWLARNTGRHNMGKEPTLCLWKKSEFFHSQIYLL